MLFLYIFIVALNTYLLFSVSHCFIFLKVVFVYISISQVDYKFRETL